MFRFIILGLLRDRQLHHGYALAKAYRARSGGDINSGNFYRELNRLGVEGLVRIVNNPTGADPRRTPYQITDSGLAAFESWLFEPPDLGDGQREDEISARVLFLIESDLPAARALVERWQTELWVRGKVIERARDEARAQSAAESDGSFGALVLLLSRRLKYVAADLQFLEEFRTAYEQWAAGSRAQRTARSVALQPARTDQVVVPRRPLRARR